LHFALQRIQTETEAVPSFGKKKKKRKYRAIDRGTEIAEQ
jgi:hypothetical protein